MPRARNIKHGFFVNEDLIELPFDVRLLFIGLWTIADREGRLEDRPLKIKIAIFPADDVDVNRGLELLQAKGFIVRYSEHDKKYIEVTNFVRHQKPHHNEPESLIPSPSQARATMEQGLAPKVEALGSDCLMLNAERGLLNGENPAKPDAYSGRSGIPRNLTPINQSSDLELNTWLAAVAVAVGAADAHSLPKRTKWETVCMSAIREQRDLGKLLSVIEAEKIRTKGQEEFFSPDTCLQKLQLNGSKASKWMHDV